MWIHGYCLYETLIDLEDSYDVLMRFNLTDSLLADDTSQMAKARHFEFISILSNLLSKYYI